MSAGADETIFEAALGVPPEERLAYLERACKGDAKLRQHVEALLQAHDHAGAFMAEPAAPASGPTVRITVPLTEKPGDKIGHYKLLQQIGEGGCGVVYMAEQEEPIRRRVAFKVIKLGMDTKQVIARFEAERQALALMDHPNIARVLDAGATDTGRPYFVMELVRGIRITDYCDQNNLCTEERLNLFIQVCHAIQHAHQKGIIHRDIKPSNILVTLNDGVPVPKVIDFGIAKATGGQLLTDKTLFTAFEQFIGTPTYMSPEQAEMTSLDIDTRSDVYALGVLLYELLTGHTPFDAKRLLSAGLDGMRRIIREQEPLRPSTCFSTLDEAEQTTVAKRRSSEPTRLIHQVQGDLDWIVMKCLEKDRTRRYETANGLANDILRHLNNEAVRARPPSRLYRFRQLVRRNKLVFAATGAVLLALLLGLALSTWLFFREGQALRRTVAAEAAESRLREQAETEAVKSRQVARFLKDMLEGVGPSVALGRDTTMLREILDKTAERVGNDLTNQPEVELELRYIIGSAYHELGQFGAAAEMQRRALDLARTVHGKDDVKVADCLFVLACSLVRQINNAEAEQLFREALTMRRKLLGDKHPAVAQSLMGLGEVFGSEGRRDEAESRLREALAILKQLPGTNKAVVVDALGTLATITWQHGKLAEAETLQRETLRQTRELWGSAHPFYAVALNNLGNILCSRNKPAEAERLQREALELDRRFKGAEHADSVNDFNNLLVTLSQQGKRDEAEPLLLAVAPPAKAAAPYLWRSRVSWRLREGRLAEAAADLRTLVAMNPDDSFNWLLLAEVLADSGNDLGYDRECQTMLARFGQTTDAGVAECIAKACLLRPGTGANLEAATQLADVAVVLAKERQATGWRAITVGLGEFRRGHFARAAECGRRVLAEPGPGNGRDLEASTLLAMACGRSGGPDESRATLASAIECARTNLTDPAGTYFSWKFHESLLAHIFLREALAIQRERLGSQHPEVAQSLSRLAELFRTKGWPAEAEAMQREALAINRKAWPNNFGKWEGDVNGLVEILRRQRKLSEAEQVFSELLPSQAPPERARLLRIRAVFRIQCGRLGEAAADLATVLDDDPKDHWRWYLLAPVLAAAGDEPNYRKHCQAMLTRFGGTNDPVIAERTAKACLLLPAAGPELEAATRLAKLAVTRGLEHDLLGFFQFAKALAEYRQGHYAAAIGWAQKSFVKPGGEPRDVETWAILSMAHYQLQRREEARQALDRAKDIATKLPAAQSAGYADAFHDVLMADILLREAKALAEAHSNSD
jgi:eukaryotic-like serine/threonine-protein kinase